MINCLKKITAIYIALTFFSPMLFAITFISNDNALNQSKLDEILTQAEEELEKSDKNSRRKGFKTLRKDRPSMFAGMGFGSANIESVLNNKTGSISNTFSSTGIDVNLGYVQNSHDYYYEYTSQTLDTSVEVVSHKLGYRYRLDSLGFVLSNFNIKPYTSLQGGMSQTNTVSGNTGAAEVGMMIFFKKSLAIKVGVNQSLTLWDYPVDGIVNYFNQTTFATAIDYRI